MTQREEIVVRAGFDNTALASGLRSAKGMVQDVASSIGRTVMGFLSVGALMSGVNSLVNKVMQIKNAAEITGQSTEGIQRLDYAFKQTGISVERGNNALERLNVKLGEARTGSAEAAAAFAKWGISITGKDNAGIVAEIADKMLEMTDPAERAAMAVDLMGRGGKDLVPLLERGAVAMAAISEHAPIFSDEDMKNLEKFHSDIEDAANRLQIWAGRGISGIAQAAQQLGILSNRDIWNVFAGIQDEGTEEFFGPSTKRELDAMQAKMAAARPSAPKTFLGPEYQPGTAETMEEAAKRNKLLEDKINLQDRMNEKTRERNLLAANQKYEEFHNRTPFVPSLEEMAAGGGFNTRLKKLYGLGGRFDLTAGPLKGQAQELERLQYQLAWNVTHPGANSEKFVTEQKSRIDELKAVFQKAGIIPAADKLDSIDNRMQTLNESIDRLNMIASKEGIVLKSN
jgi:hypothetical protein